MMILMNQNELIRFLEEKMKKYVHHLSNPADNWENASPVGCGSMGLMVFGTVASEHLSLNEESIWSGGSMDTKIEGYSDKIAHVRKLFLEGREDEADEWATANMDDCFKRIKSYEYAGYVDIKFHDDDSCGDYCRDIDLINGLLNISYKKDGVGYTREYFASYPAKLICARYTSEAEFSAEIAYSREKLISLSYRPDYIIAEAKTAYGDNRFNVYVKIVTDGESVASRDGVKISGATYVETYTSIVTAFKYDDLLSASAAILARAERGWDALKREHTDDFSSLMGRSDLSFNGEDFSSLTVSERLERLKNDPDAVDNGLMSLYWQFGKYLLVSSSREGTLPANLQGVWADGLESPWNSDYHTNINLQMNYWHAEEANISDCTFALFDYMNNYLMPGGEKVARENYGTRGIVVHHVSDIYGFAAAADGLWGLWPLGAAWLSYHMWEHYLYTKDTDFLKNTAYRFIRGCAEFFVDNMFEGNDGYMHTGPSTSPENRYYKNVNGEKKAVYLAVSPTMDIEIVGGLFDFYAEAEDILGISPENARIVRELRAKMPPLRVGKMGQLMEWLEDYDEVEPGHRHISHAFALYPSAQINHSTPELLKAIERTLELRLSSGGGHTGWSRAWLINLFARLEDSEKTYENIRALLTRSTLPNLFDTHPPFQIDGNFGGAAGIGEMVMQSHEEYISIIPAVPEGLSGSFTGLRARGGYTVSAEWKNGTVTSLYVKPDFTGVVKFRLPDGDIIDVKLDSLDEVKII